MNIIQQNIEAIQNRQLEVFLKTTIDNIEFFLKKSTTTSPLYKKMIVVFNKRLAHLNFESFKHRIWSWRFLFTSYRLYRKDFRKLLIILPFITEAARDYGFLQHTVCANYLRFFRKKNKTVLMEFPHCVRTSEVETIGLYYRIAMKKPKHLTPFRGEWSVTRKHAVLTKKKYEKLYFKNNDVYEVLVYEDIKKRSLLYYTDFVDKILNYKTSNWPLPKKHCLLNLE